MFFGPNVKKDAQTIKLIIEAASNLLSTLTALEEVKDHFYSQRHRSEIQVGINEDHVVVMWEAVPIQLTFRSDSSKNELTCDAICKEHYYGYRVHLIGHPNIFSLVSGGTFHQPTKNAFKLSKEMELLGIPDAS